MDGHVREQPGVSRGLIPLEVDQGPLWKVSKEGCDRCRGIPWEHLQKLRTLYTMIDPKFTKKEQTIYDLLRQAYPESVEDSVLRTKSRTTDSALRQVMKRVRDKLPRNLRVDNSWHKYTLVVQG